MDVWDYSTGQLNDNADNLQVLWKKIKKKFKLTN